ncbi:MAG: hypothetical protein IKX75_06695, partial [Desulfovibrio sp.]|nr:hypothetical protein [Desulfovibrio sp.]
ALARRDLRLVESWLAEQELGDDELKVVETVEPQTGDLLNFEPAMDGYSVADWDAFKHAVGEWPDLVPFEDRGRGIYGWRWTVPARPGRTQAEAADLIPWHEFEDEDDTLYVESYSKAFGDAAMRMLEERFGKAVRLEWRSRGDMDNFMHWPMPGNDDPEGQDDWICEFVARANLEQAFMPLEELGGRSVARCAGLKSMRAKAVEWLKHFENAEARRGQDEDMPGPLELDWLWDMLRLERWPEQVRAALAPDPGN